LWLWRVERLGLVLLLLLMLPGLLLLMLLLWLVKMLDVLLLLVLVFVLLVMLLFLVLLLERLSTVLLLMLMLETSRARCDLWMLPYFFLLSSRNKWRCRVHLLEVVIVSIRSSMWSSGLSIFQDWPEMLVPDCPPLSQKLVVRCAGLLRRRRPSYCPWLFRSDEMGQADLRAIVAERRDISANIG
jgi:hypothetical protein